MRAASLEVRARDRAGEPELAEGLVGIVEKRKRGVGVSILKSPAMDVERSDFTGNIFDQAIVFLFLGDGGLKGLGIYVSSMPDPFPFHWCGRWLRVGLGFGG